MADRVSTADIVPVEDWPELAKKFRNLSSQKKLRVRDESPELYRTMRAAYMRPMALNSFWFFAKHILKNPVMHQPLHKPLCDWAQTWDDRDKLLLMSRGHIKSNLYNVGYALWEICKDTNIRVLIGSHKDPDARKFVMMIARIVDNNETFKDVFPDIRPALGYNKRREKWSEEHLLFDREVDYIEPTVQMTSPKSSVTGRHYDLMILDDLVNEKNVNTPDLIEGVRGFHELCSSLLDPGSREFIIGTRYHFDDRYGEILDTPELRELYDVREVPYSRKPEIVNEYIANPKQWKREHDFLYLAYPKRYTLAPKDYKHPTDKNKNRKSLPKIRKKQGATHFANQYQLQPRDPSDKVFDVNQIRTVDYVPDQVSYYQFLDHASEKHTNSNTALVTCAVTPYQDIIIVDVFWGTKTNRETADELFYWQNDPERKPIFVGTENGPYEINLKAYVRERERELKAFIPFKALKGYDHNEVKIDHIKSLQPWVEMGKISILHSCRNRGQILEEFDKFPKGSQMDCIDALAQITKLVLPSKTGEFLSRKVPEQEEEKHGVTMDEVIAMEDRKHGVIGRHQVRKPGAKRALVRF